MNSHFMTEYGSQNRVKTARKRPKLQKMPKNDLPGLLPVSTLWRKKFFGLTCLVVSVGNKVSFKIYSNQANQYTCSDCPQENTDFPHLDPVVPRVKFGSFFQNSYRSNDLTNS